MFNIDYAKLEARVVLESTLGKEFADRILGPEISEEVTRSIELIYSDFKPEERQYMNTNFEEENGELYSIFEVKVVLKRLRVLYPEMKITVPALLIILLHSGVVGQVVENFELFVKDAKSEKSNEITALNCKCWHTWPVRR